MDDYKAAFRVAKANRAAGQQLSREQVRAMRARRDQGREQKSENAMCSTMPPPPPRSITVNPSTSAVEFHEDSQATRIDGGGAVVNGGNLRSEPSVNNKGAITESAQPETATEFTVNEAVTGLGFTEQEPQVQVPSVSGSTMGQDLFGEESARGPGATSQLSLSFSQARSSASGGQVQQSKTHETSETLPTGFFEDAKPGKIAENINSEFDAFMEEVSKMGKKDLGGPSAEELEKATSLEPEENRTIDYDDFEQFVRREHLREIQERLDLARKRRLDQAPPEAASNESGEEKGATVLEIAGLEPEIEVAKVVLPPPKRRRIEPGFQNSEDESENEAEDGGLLNWRSKRLPTT